MKKFLTLVLLCLSIPVFTACEISNTELANSLEGNMTRLVYSIGYLDSISVEELSSVVNNSTYFTHSSLYNNPDNTANDESISTTANNLNNSSLSQTLTNTNTLNQTMSSPSRFRTYTNGLENNNLLNNTTTSEETPVYSPGTVDMTLLETSASDLNQILLDISGKRGIIMLYCTDLRSGRTSLSAQAKSAINEYNNIIKETTNYLNNNTGTLTNHFNNISSISTTENSADLINAKLIRANEVLKTRYAKLDTCLDSLDAIINILVNSIGYDYTALYNQSLANNSVNTTTSQTAPNTNTTSISLDNNETCNSTETNDVKDGTCNDKIMLNETNSTCNNCLNNTSNNNCNNCETTLPQNYPVTLPENSTTYPLTKPSSNPVGDTIINYNYEGNNSSNIISTSPAVNNDTIAQPQTTTIVDNNLNTNTPSLPNANSNSLVVSEPSKTEIALNGGLIRKGNEEKIPSENVNSLVAKVGLVQTPNLQENTNKNENAEQLKLARPLEKVEDSKFENLTPTPNLSEPEISESEKELTPELLPFTGLDNNNFNLKPLEKSPELGNISLTPFKYQEDDVLKKTPRL